MSGGQVLTVRLDEAMSNRLGQFLVDNPEMSGATATVRALDAFLPRLSKVKPAGASATNGGGQDEISGRAGRDFGVSAGRALAEKLGRLVSPVATELELKDGRKATLRTAKKRNTQWGCLKTVLERVDVVLCAYTSDENHFEVWEVNVADWIEHGRNASSGHKLHNKMLLMGKSDVRRFGRKFADIEL